MSLKVFDKHCNSLMNLLRSADVYALLKLDDIRGEEKGMALAREVITKSGSSSLVHSKHFFLSREEQALFEKDGYVTEICEQIVQSAYAAVENYLINFFKKELEIKVNDEALYLAILSNISLRSLSWIKKHYKHFLNIDLAEFKHHDICTYEESCFKPQTEWQGLTLLSKVRNEIAHNGFSRSMPIHYPVDAYSIIFFIKRWVLFFDLKYGGNQLAD